MLFAKILKNKLTQKFIDLIIYSLSVIPCTLTALNRGAYNCPSSFSRNEQVFCRLKNK